MPGVLAQVKNNTGPMMFDTFFELGEEGSASPFLTPEGRKWGHNLPVKAAALSALLLTASFGFSFFTLLLPLSYLLLVGVYFLAGAPSLIESIEELINLQINIDVLMTLAAFSSVLIGSGFEGGLLLVLFSLSGAMEETVTAKAKGAIAKLRELSPSRAFVIETDGTLVHRFISDVNVGDTILVKAGEIVPLDAVVLSGGSSVNLIHLTGENLPVPKVANDEVPAGAQNLEGALTLHVIRTSADSTLARIIKLVTQAQESRPNLQRWFDKVSERYAISIIGSAAIFATTLPFIFNIPFLGVGGGLYRALAFLIAASPCALILAIPIAYLSAVSACARKGILLKGGVTLDALAKCEIIAFDKTGTLTTGHLVCTGLEALSPTHVGREETALATAAAMEKNAVHPIAHAITQLADQSGVVAAHIDNFRVVPGYGVQATFAGPQEKRALLGRYVFIEPHLSPELLAKAKERITSLKEQGELLALLLLEEELFLFRFSDSPRPKIRQTIEELKKEERWRLLMLTGDHLNSARKVAHDVGITEYYADLLPEHKLQYVTTLANEKGLAMIGDGLNDAPALARATVGICMGQIGSQTAAAASDVVLLHDDLTLLSWLMNKARQTQNIVNQNLVVATLAIIVAGSSALFGLIPLWIAVIMHEGGTLLVGLNALRLLQN